MNQERILPFCAIKNRIDEECEFSGIDCEEHCFSPAHFKNYPHKISYKFNSRGFRDSEWPQDHLLSSAVWCLGDSFTVGIGVPYEHTWPYLLQQKLNQRTINVSMDGASNNWIARHAEKIIEIIAPKVLVVQWSFLTRRESSYNQLVNHLWNQYYNSIKDPSWPECAKYADFHHLPEYIQAEIRDQHQGQGFGWLKHHDLETERRVHFTLSTHEEDLKNTQDCIDTISKQSTTTVIHSFIPGFDARFNKPNIRAFNFHGMPVCPEIKQLDLGRDGFHYDIKTARFVVDKIIERIANLAAA